MDYYLASEEINELSQRIKFLTQEEQPSYKSHKDDEIIEMSVKWNMPRLFSQILLFAKSIEKFSERDLENFHAEYQIEYKLEIDLNVSVRASTASHNYGII